MSDQGGLVSEEVAVSPAGPAAEPQIAPKKVQDGKSIEERREITDEEEEEEGEEEEEEEEDEEEKTTSALLEPSTLPWPADKDGVWSEKRVPEPEEKDTEVTGGSQDLPEESDRKSKARWRESMPEGERWRDDESEVQKDDKGDGSLADDEDEEEEEEEGGGESKWISEKAALGFTPQVTIVCPSRKEPPAESRLFVERDAKEEAQREPDSAAQFYPEWTEQDGKYCEYNALTGLCSIWTHVYV